MTVEALPIEIEGHTYLFRLEDGDVKEIERTLSLFMAFHPQYITYENAALFLQHALRKKGPDGNLMYIFPQDETGRGPAFDYVKKFCGEFHGTDGILLLYGYIDKALVALEWRRPTLKKKEPAAAEPETPEERDPPKNSVKPTSGLTRRLRMVFAGLLRRSSGD